MKSEERIEGRLRILKKNIGMIKDEQGRARIQNYINALKWVLSNKDDQADEMNRLMGN